MIAVLLSRLALGAAAVAVLLFPGNAVRKERPAAVAGMFYPADRAELQKNVDAMLAAAKGPALEGQLWAVVAPHAGYPYSGPVAAHAYALLQGRHYRRVVVISPSHYDAFPFAAVYDGDAYVTPLGTVPVDKAFAAKLAKGPYLKLSSRGHIQQGEQREHALEVQLPFLQRTLGNFELVPVIVGDQSYAVTRALGVALAGLIHSPDTLIVASSDLSHFHTYDQAVAMDSKPLRALQDWDYFSMARNFATREWEACGGGPMVAAMIAAERLGARQAVLLKYANTGDVTGDRSRVVGYGAAAFLQPVWHGSPTREEFPEYALSQADKEQLLTVARKSVEITVQSRRSYVPSDTASAPLLEDRGAFVTLKKHGELRGCIGYTSAAKPLRDTVRDVAAYAAVRDPRFPPVREDELKDLEYEVSVLSPFRRVTDFNQVQVGRHGLMVVNGNYLGLLLPQVPTEQGWDRATFLDETCMKAGLSRGCWKDPDTDVFMFTALVFGESKK